jgi:hypothetical protein
MKKIKMKKISIIATILLSVMLLFTAVASAFKGDLNKTIVALLIQICIVLPFIINHFIRKRGIIIPAGIILTYEASFFATFYLGDLMGFYEKFKWWDKSLHFLSGIVLTIIGFYIIDVVNIVQKSTLITDSFFIVFFSVCFANTAGKLWEIAEFITDVIGATHKSQGSLEDTMIDMSLNMVSSLITAVIYYFYRRKKVRNTTFK